ncbi:penicillin acylase family protein [Thermolongibacillus altinsuensis]|uniref:penicillin acylase family protein n=1 Tax=Thermolongibacillus altinsuensis TaxID=575256 RepID=UPI00242A320D|nr:penicillin acylase family protein [Thermolongibacillus altinsuensis]GMB08195.1 beta-lactam antibiotic acylase [Thermolongibacillus altinsuensis]
MEVAVKIKPKRLKKILGVSLAVLALLLLSGVIFANVYINRSLPQTEGELAVSGLSEQVKVVRDEQGVPHITAKNEHDLYFVQGFVQAQDRLFQMDLSRRQASGRLSEVIGEATVDRDKFFRTLGLRRAAEASYGAYSEEAKKVLQAFADGVNAYISLAKKEGRLPLEFKLLNYEPEKWTPIDSLTIGKYMAFDLGGHWEGQAFRYWALKNLSEEKAYDLFPSYPKDAPTILQAYKDVPLSIEKAFANAVIPPELNGSNNWVVSGEKTKNGKPLLADDPHLSLSTPSIWYQMHLQAPTVNVSGVIFAGIPGIILGHNEHVAWGVTNTGPDVQDLYIEKRNPHNKHQFLYNGNWEEATIVKEPIQVKGGKTIPYEVAITRHGPVISEFAYPSDDDTVLALRWTALDPSLELQAVLKMNQAKNWEEFEKALENFHVPTQNFVFASKDGTIAYKANGKIPIRQKGDGLLPVPGWTDEYEWNGFIPYDELPRSVNPQEGFIATANNKVIGDDYPYHISHHWAQPYRYMRIAQYLEGKDQLTLADMKELQMDQKNLWAEEFVPIMLKSLQSASLEEIDQKAIAQLEKWNYVDSPDKAAPLIFHLWMKEIPHVLFKEEIPEEIDQLFEGKQAVVDELIRRAANGDVSPWFTEKGGLTEVLHTSLHNVLERLSEKFGDDPSDWKWGDYHQLYFAHPMSSSSSLLKFFLNREKPIPIGGSQVTVQAASFEENGIVNHGASWRFVIDLSDIENGQHIVGPGQAGHFKSRWYHNQINDWATGKYHTTTITELKEGDILTLSPK